MSSSDGFVVAAVHWHSYPSPLDRLTDIEILITHLCFSVPSREPEFVMKVFVVVSYVCTNTRTNSNQNYFYYILFT